MAESAQYYYALEVPIFAAMIGAEMLVARAQGRRVYRFADTISNLGCGLGEQAVGVLLGPLMLGAYLFVQQHLALVHWREGSWAPWVIAFVGVDFLYYWFHRKQHEVNALWALHVVHHQSEDYNIAVALRQTWFSDITGALFYWPMPLLGIPLTPFLVAAAFLSLYQTWLHTSTVRGLKTWGIVFNTPSHHRVHHARNARYIGRNYGATLIVWDRLFRTLEPEVEEADFGIDRPIRTWNPVLAQGRTFAHLLQLARAAQRPIDRIRVWLAPPEWVPVGAETIVQAPIDLSHYDRCAPRSVNGYVFLQFVVTVVGNTALVVWEPLLARWVIWAGVALILATLATWGGLLETRPWARAAELVRLAACALVGVFAAPSISWLCVVAAIACALWLLRLPLSAPAAAGDRSPPSPAGSAAPTIR